MALDIGGFEEAGIVDHTFVMHQTGVIKATDHLCHLEQGLTTKRFVAQRPDQNSRVIFVTLVSGIHAVNQDIFPLRLIIGQNACLLYTSMRYYSGRCGAERINSPSGTAAL